MATTAEYLDKLVTQKNTLADNLATKGVTATHEETLETLVPKVLDISGGGGTGGGSIEIVNSLPENPDVNTLYKYTDVNLGDLLLMYCNEHWRYVALSLYPEKVFISPTEIYTTGYIFGSTPLDAISVVDLAEPVEVGKLIATKALKISGQNLGNIEYGWTFNINVPQNITLGERYLYIGVSAEAAGSKLYDYASVIVNGGDAVTYSTTSNVLTTFAIPLKTLISGANEITVKYIKDASGAALDDCVYIYGVDYLYTM